MCRSIKTLYNYEPPASEREIRDAALQFVRKISGFTKPSQVNEDAFNRAVDAITAVSADLLASLETKAAPRNRAEEVTRARARAARRYSINSNETMNHKA